MVTKSYTLNQTMSILNKFCAVNNFSNLEVVKWIVVKTLRLKRDQFDYIKIIDEYQIASMKNSIFKYINGQSLSKIFGYIEFYGNYFDVTENVFDPRLSTEALVSSILKVVDKGNKKLEIIDLCTGSGCIAITLSKMLNLKIDALDISPLAIEVAQKNAQKLNGQVEFIEFDLNCNWADVLIKKYDIIVSNPPYWNTEKILKNFDVIRNNPLDAFDGGVDGLKYIKIIIENSKNHLNDNGMLFLEIDPEQIEKVKSILKENGFTKIKVEKDHNNIDRVVYAVKKE